MNREDEAIALSDRHHNGPGLHTWPLLGHDKFTTREIFVRVR